MQMQKILFFMVLFFAAPALAVTGSGLPVPRFVSLKSDETNARTGPGTRYPIAWVYRRAGMPMEVVDEFDQWRKIRDMDGTSGWVHRSMLDGKRKAMVKGKEAQLLRIDHDEKAKPLLKVEPTVLGALLECVPQWCRIQVSGRKGWMEKSHLWGVYQNEVFD